ncbi:hypothetical protein QYE76_038528, partial [Lolium multiflorum]
VPNKNKDKTPYEEWSGRKPSLSYLRTWGCLAKVNIPITKKRKLGPKTVDCIFLGYAPRSVGYRFLVVQSEIVPESSTSNEYFEQSHEIVIEKDDNEAPKRSKRRRIEKSFGDDFIVYLVDDTPTSIAEAYASPDADDWKEAVHNEMDSILSNGTWELSERPHGCKPVGCKWVFKKKLRPDGTIEKYKARLVAKGYTQREGEDYFDTYSPVARLTTIRVLLSMAASYGLIVHQMDVKTAFLNGELEEEIYMDQPDGFVVKGEERKVCKLLKSLYGLKQAPKQWHEKFDRTLTSVGFVVNEADKCVYYRHGGGEGVILCLYVDDILIFGTNMKVIHEVKSFLSKSFDMKDLGEADVILNIKLIKNESGITLTQSHYVEKILSRVMRYLCGTMSYGIHYSGHPAVLEGYSDSNWISDVADLYATSGTSNEYFEQSHEIVIEKDDNEAPKRSKRRRIEKSFGDDFIVYLVDDTPTSIAEAYASPDADDWKEAVHNEMDSILSNGTWELSERPHGCKPVGCKWVFKKKLRPDGTIEKYKARLVAKGYTQREGEDYFDTYSPVARLTTIRVLLSMAASYGLIVHQMDVKTAFLNGELEEEIYMDQPDGFVVKGEERKVCKLLKSLYGLKQAPKQWHEKFDRTLTSVGFVVNEADKCVYYRHGGGEGVILCLYVDDILIFGTNMKVIHEVKSFLSKSFDMKDLGEADVILNIKLIKNESGITLTQSHYVEKILSRVMRYLCGTMSYGIHYSGHPAVLEGYSDSNWISDVADLYATSGNFATTLKHKRQEISVENLIASLDVEEKARAKDTTEKGEGQSSANMVQKKPYSKNKGNNKPSFNKPMKTTTFKKKKMINKADLSCFTCGEAGHFSKDCPERADRKKKAKQVNTVTASNADGYGNLFTVLSVARDSSVLMGNGSHASVRGVGTDDNEAPKRSKRRRIEKSFGDDFIVYLVDDTPTSIAEAYASPDADDWKEAVHNEMDSILSNGTWELSERPHGCKPVGCKWVFKKKLRPDGTIEKYKARLVAKGYTQREGEDYFDTYSPSLDLPPFEYYFPWLPPMVLSFIKWT